MKKILFLAGLFLIPAFTLFGQLQTFDLSSVNIAPADWQTLTPTTVKTGNITQQNLENTIKDLEDEMEEIRNERKQATSSFENLDQKNEQLYNMLSSILRQMKEMQSATIRNML